MVQLIDLFMGYVTIIFSDLAKEKKAAATPVADKILLMCQSPVGGVKICPVRGMFKDYFFRMV